MQDTSKFQACYTVVLGNRAGERIGLVKYGETGYYAVRDWDDPAQSLEECKTQVAELNARLGLPEDVCESMQYASCFGWDAPIAERAHSYFNPQPVR